ncbi:MAG TPA: GC-type dockerin domain-anchored protein [Vicinamibacterales bacterium]|nr:GC-type dockerin domain-anchored protein [Vicinamibacterales bacterium]
MTRSARILAACGAASLAAPAIAQVRLWVDATADAVVRRTDSGNDGPIHPDATIPDLARVSLCAWQPLDPESDPYAGEAIAASGAHLFRLDVVFSGLVNPPGPLGLGGEPFDPLRFGVSPVYGFLDLDVDEQKNSGGELGSLALDRYLANVARFGYVPYGSIGERAAHSADDWDSNFWTPPQFERTGAEFSLVLCGCWTPTLAEERTGDGDAVFDAGEAWVVRGRFFERFQSFADVSFIFGGSDAGLYDPVSHVLWAHDALSNETTVSLVFPLDMTGAAMLTGEAQQAMDFNAGNHASLAEALADLCDQSEDASGALRELVKDWRGRDYDDYLDPTEWDVSALFGTTYSTTVGALYAWTDSGFGEKRGDFDGNGLADAADRAMLDTFIAGGPVDIPGFALNFSIFDLDYSGVVDTADADDVLHPADFDANGIVNTLDFLAFLNAFNSGDPRADFDGNGIINSLDVLAFLVAFNTP